MGMSWSMAAGSGGHDHAGDQNASDLLVSGLVPDRPGQNRNLLAGAQPPPGRERRHGLAAARQGSAGDGFSGVPPQAALHAGGDERTDRECALLLDVLHRAGSLGRRGLWVIKNP